MVPNAEIFAPKGSTAAFTRTDSAERDATASTAMASPVYDIGTYDNCPSFGSAYYCHNIEDSNLGTTELYAWAVRQSPTIGANDSHSLTQVWAVGPGHTTHEIGVRKGLNDQPRIFVFHFDNNVATCYNGCGYVSYNNPEYAGKALSNNGQTDTFGVYYSAGYWFYYFNGYWIGYIPNSAFNYPMSQTTTVQAGGEVASVFDNTPTTDMGNGFYGASPSANGALISQVAIGQGVFLNPSRYGVSGYNGYNLGWGNGATGAVRYGGPGFP